MPWTMKVFSGNANIPLAQEVCDVLGIPMGKAKVTRFSDGEVNVQILESVRGSDVFLIQPTCPPVDENLMELLVMLDALRRASAGRVTAVIPYYGYARQDRKVQPRVPITAKLVADLLTAAGADRVLTVDLHAGQIQGFFNIPVDNLLAMPIFLQYMEDKGVDNLVVVSPDAGGVERARAFAKKLHLPLAIIDKRRVADNVAEVMHVIGDVEGKRAFILDDMIDTGGTLVKSVEALMEQGAVECIAAATHPVFSGPARDRIESSALQEVVVTNTIPLKVGFTKVKVLSVAPLMAEAIKRIHLGESVSSLFV
ncbi:MAG: phosphoribosylpyrophosphate synthetase [Aquificota bacterium]|nr:MAG: phosphoribosylpyrophosphate synthetase [Aquificota bacterium]